MLQLTYIPETVECCNCDDNIEKDGAKEQDGSWYCEDCYDENFTICDGCADVISNDDIRHTDCGDSYCDSCYDDRYTSCEWCSSETHTDDLCHVEGAWICESCYSNDCGCCSDCGESFHTDNLQVHNDDWYCEDCVPQSCIQEYNYRPYPRCKQASGEVSETFIGIELEVNRKDADDEDCNTMAEQIEWEEHLYFKKDSSISNSRWEGFEIVSHPATWKWWNAQKRRIASILERLRNNEFRSYESGLCGMHIHISKAGLSPLTIFKLQKLVYENAGTAHKLSCRRLADLSQWASVDDKDNKQRIELSKKRAISKTRYSALNFTNKTIEFRLFRGTLAEAGFWRNMEIVQSMIQFCERYGMEQMTEQMYLDYVRANKKEYPNLAEFIGRKF